MTGSITPDLAPDPAASAAALHAPATGRNREPILAILSRVLPPRGTVLEIASGTGEHAAWFAPRLPGRRWLPSDPLPGHRASIAAHAAVAAPDMPAALDLDVTRPDWPAAPREAAGEAGIAALVCINMIHIAPWAAAQGLFRGAAELLPGGGILYLYGPFRVGGAHTARSNAAFDRDLRARDPRWGVRDLEEVAMLGGDLGLELVETAGMPANNLSAVFRRRRVDTRDWPEL